MSECVRIIDTNKIFSQFYNKDKDSERQQEILFLICSLLRMANYYHSKNVMNALISTMEGYDTEYLKPMFLRFYHTLIESFEEIDFSCLTEKVKKIKLFKAFPELKDFMQNLFNDFVDIIVVSSNKNVGISSDAIILRAKSLVESNLDNSDISLEYVANKVYLNPIYFSRFFKQHTGENFVEYLISTRIQKAKELLVCDNFRIYEISAMVGYQDAKYFTRLFKKETGLTPTEYRQIQW
jgi:two-component system response regulator YesN